MLARANRRADLQSRLAPVADGILQRARFIDAIRWRLVAFLTSHGSYSLFSHPLN
jgi:hypothetical protein